MKEFLFAVAMGAAFTYLWTGGHRPVGCQFAGESKGSIVYLMGCAR